MRRRTLLTAVVPLAAAAVVCTTGASAGTRRLTGALPGGATWLAEVPANWNGVLLLYCHGYRPPMFFDTNDAQHAPSPQVAEALLARGYALAGSSYADLGWVVDSAVRDQLATVSAVEAVVGAAGTRIAYGTSMGAIVASRLARDGRFAGMLTACGALAGGRGLVDNQLHGDFALARLLLDSPDAVALSGLTGPEQALASAAALADAAARALNSADGRARLSLAAALYHLPTWSQGAKPAAHDHVARLAAQADFLAGGLLSLFFGSRLDIEARAGGPVAGNAGVDYTRLFARTATHRQVRALYAAVGRNLGADLDRLTRHAHVVPRDDARAWLARTSDTVAELTVPHLSLHTVADEAIPVEHQQAYGARVRAAGRAHLLRQAYLDRVGHTEITTAEHVAAVTALTARVHSGHWGAVAHPSALQRRAMALDLGEAAFTAFTPGRF